MIYVIIFGACIFILTIFFLYGMIHVYPSLLAKKHILENYKLETFNQTKAKSSYEIIGLRSTFSVFYKEVIIYYNSNNVIESSTIIILPQKESMLQNFIFPNHFYYCFDRSLKNEKYQKLFSTFKIITFLKSQIKIKTENKGIIRMKVEKNIIIKLP